MGVTAALSAVPVVLAAAGKLSAMDRIGLEPDVMMAWRIGISNANLSRIENSRVTALRFSTLAGIREAPDCEPATS